MSFESISSLNAVCALHKTEKMYLEFGAELTSGCCTFESNGEEDIKANMDDPLAKDEECPFEDSEDRGDTLVAILEPHSESATSLCTN